MRIVGTVTALLVIAAGCVMFPLPIPFGAVTMIAGWTLLVAVNPPLAAFVRSRLPKRFEQLLKINTRSESHSRSTCRTQNQPAAPRPNESSNSEELCSVSDSSANP